jgi:AGZA family xanthine/uracil permease-like MFS transporter
LFVIEKLFRLREMGTTPGREVMAGLTTFAAMAYILVVNPNVLADAGMPREATVTGTALAAAGATLLMAFLANLPLALAPGMGINAFFAYAICLGMKVPWPSALALVFCNGLVFLLLSVTGVRERIVHAIPPSIKAATCAGIGIFIAFIGLKNGGMVVAHEATFVSMGDLTRPPVALFAFGILLACVLIARQVPGAVLLTMATVTVIGFFVPDGAGGMVTKLPEALTSMPKSIAPVLFKLDFNFLFHNPLEALPVVLTLLLVDLFDNLGTLIGVTKRAGLVKEGKIPNLPRALVADSLAAILSSVLGTSTVVSYIESSAGVQAGGRTGLTSVTVAVLFLLALFFSPVLLCIPAVAVAPALVVVGILMFESVAEIDLGHFEIAAPAILTLIAMPLTFSISTGLGLGMIATVAISLGSGRAKDYITPYTYGLAAIFLVHFLKPLAFLWLRK